MMEMGYLLDSGNRSGIGLVGRSPWTEADALVRLLAGRPGGRPRARAPAPHRSTERGLPESSRYPTDGNAAARQGAVAFWARSKPEPQIYGKFAHSGGGRRQTVIGGVQNRTPVGNRHVVEQVLRLELQVGAAPLPYAEDAPQRPVQRKRGWPGNGVTYRIAPQPGKRRGEGRGIEQLPGAFHRQ